MADKGFILQVAGRVDESLALLKQIEATDPAFLSAHQYLSWIYRDRHEYPVYFDELDAAARLQDDPDARSSAAEDRKIFDREGFRAVLQARLNRDLRLYERGIATDFTLAADYAQLNEKQTALDHLEKAYQQHDLNLCTLLVNGSLRPLRGEAQFKELASKVGLPETR